jgi:hypothetical protein
VSCSGANDDSRSATRPARGDPPSEIDATSIDTGNAQRDADPRSSDFPDSAAYPTNWNQAAGVGVSLFGTTLKISIDVNAVLQT